MSFQYDQYLARHRANVKRGFDWLSENLPGLMTNTLTAGWNTEFAHDQSKNEPDEYEAYDAYFYGNNRSYEVVQRYQRAWLLLDTIKESSHVRHKYYGVDTEYIGTIFTELRDKTISDNSSFYENSTIEETVDYLESDWELWLFWVIWIIVIGLCVFGFYYIDNEWIEN